MMYILNTKDPLVAGYLKRFYNLYKVGKPYPAKGHYIRHDGQAMVILAREGDGATRWPTYCLIPVEENLKIEDFV